MGKSQKLKAKVAASQPEATPVALQIGRHKLRHFDGADAAFGARLADYPPMAEVPEGIRKHEAVASSLFFRGGRIEDFGLTIKPELSMSQVYTAIRALLCSFDPKHEHKTAVVGWALSEWCDGTPTT